MGKLVARVNFATKTDKKRKEFCRKKIIEDLADVKTLNNVINDIDLSAGSMSNDRLPSQILIQKHSLLWVFFLSAKQRWFYSKFWQVLFSILGSKVGCAVNLHRFCLALFKFSSAWHCLALAYFMLTLYSSYCL